MYNTFHFYHSTNSSIAFIAMDVRTAMKSSSSIGISVRAMAGCLRIHCVMSAACGHSYKMATVGFRKKWLRSTLAESSSSLSFDHCRSNTLWFPPKDKFRRFPRLDRPNFDFQYISHHEHRRHYHAETRHHAQRKRCSRCVQE